MTEAPRAWKMWKLDRIRPYPNNARTHPPGQITLLASMLKRWGADQPIVVDEAGVILKGHGRLLAALEAGLRDFPVVQRLGLPEEEKKALRLADNQVALLSGWDADLIKGELTELKLAGFDIPFLGFPEIQLRGFGFQIGTEGLADPEAAPEPPARPVSRRGDLWILGDHRLLCGDATSGSDVGACSGGQRAAMTFTDPPYGVAYRDTGAGAWNEKKLAKKKAGLLKPRFEAIANDDLDEEQLFKFLAAYMRIQPLAKNAAQYVFHASLRAHVFREALMETGYVVRAELVWAKTRPAMNFSQYKHKHEPFYYAVPRKGTVGWYGDLSQTTLWEVASESGAVYEHPTQKPVGLAVKAIGNSSRAGDHVYEPFSGSGSTLVGCEMTKRRALAIEIDPAYVDVAVLRWQNFTGKLARLEGRTYAEVKHEREQGHATRHSRKSVQGKDARGNGSKRPVRKAVHDGLAAARRKPAREPPPVAGNP